MISNCSTPSIFRRLFSYVMLQVASIFWMVAVDGGTASAKEILLHLPTQVYCYSFVAAPELNCTMRQHEIESMFNDVNRIWKQAGIQWDLISVKSWNVDGKEFPPLLGNEDRYEVKRRFFTVSADPSGSVRTWNIAIVRDFIVPAGGIYFPKKHTVYFAETTPRGKTKAVVLAHELGHSLGLAHTDHPYNLMGVGKPGERRELTKKQIATVRTQAAKGPADIIDMKGLGGEAARKGGLSDAAIRDQRKKMSGRRAQGTSGNMGLSQRRQRIVSRLKRFDLDGDGEIHLEDVPAPGQAMFQRIDVNHDGKLDARELNEFQY